MYKAKLLRTAIPFLIGIWGIGCHTEQGNENDSEEQRCVPAELVTFCSILENDLQFSISDSFCHERVDVDVFGQGEADSNTSYSYSSYSFTTTSFKPEFTAALYEFVTYADRYKLYDFFRLSGFAKSPVILIEAGQQVFSLSTPASMNQDALLELFSRVKPKLVKRYGSVAVNRINFNSSTQDSTLLVSKNGERSEVYEKDTTISCYFSRLTQDDLVTIHRPALNAFVYVGDSIDYVFQDGRGNDIARGKAVVNSESAIIIKDVDYVGIFRDHMAVRLYCKVLKYPYVAFIIYK